jgi:hypothetical protein
MARRGRFAVVAVGVALVAVWALAARIVVRPPQR